MRKKTKKENSNKEEKIKQRKKEKGRIRKRRTTPKKTKTKRNVSFRFGVLLNKRLDNLFFLSHLKIPFRNPVGKFHKVELNLDIDREASVE